MSNNWVDFSAEIHCDTKQEAELIAAFINDGGPYSAVSAEVRTWSKEPEVGLYMKYSDVSSDFDEELEELWKAVYEWFGKKITGRVIEEGDGYNWIAEFTSEGKLDGECIDFLKELSVEQIRKTYEFVQKLKEEDSKK